MFCLECRHSLPIFATGSPWHLIACITPEERSLGFPVLANSMGILPSSTRLLLPSHKGSQWEFESKAKQEEAIRNFPSNFGFTNINNCIFSYGSSSTETASIATQCIEDLTQSLSDIHLVIDISTMPNSCLFPMIKYALESPKINTVAVTYTEPNNYGVTLRSDPFVPQGIQSFNHLVPGRRVSAAWIPILGFGSFFGELVFDSIKPDALIENRIFPLLGFPGFNPNLYDRVLQDNLGNFLDLFRNDPQIGHQIIYSAAYDPFAAKQTILDAIRSFPNLHWIGSPMGPKPMALGMLLAAMEEKMSIIDCQAKSIHPDCSSGVGEIRFYILK